MRINDKLPIIVMIGAYALTIGWVGFLIWVGVKVVGILSDYVDKM